MTAECAYKKKKYTITTDRWTAIVAPIRCNYVAFHHKGSADLDFQHNSDLLMRSDEADPTTEDTLKTGDQEGIMIPLTPNQAEVRFNFGDCVIYFKSSGEFSQTLVVTWVR